MLGRNGDAWLRRWQMQVARELRSNRWSQQEIADILGTTQSTISRQYLRELPSLAGSADEAEVDAWAHEIATALISVGPTAVVTRQRLIVDTHISGRSVMSDHTLTGADLDTDASQRALLKSMEWAAGRLDPRWIGAHMPAVGMNLVACLPDAEQRADIAGFPGRIRMLGSNLRTMATPEFGSSNHMAGILHEARALDPRKCAALNLRPPIKEDAVDVARVARAMDELGFTLARCQRGVIDDHPGRLDGLLDPGGFGWEPSLYLLAHTPLELVDRAHRIAEVLG